MKIFFMVNGNPANVKNIKTDLTCISHLSGKTEIKRRNFKLYCQLLKLLLYFYAFTVTSQLLIIHTSGFQNVGCELGSNDTFTGIVYPA